MERHLDRHLASDIWDERSFGRFCEDMDCITSSEVSTVVCCMLDGRIVRH